MMHGVEERTELQTSFLLQTQPGHDPMVQSRNGIRQFLDNIAIGVPMQLENHLLCDKSNRK